MVWKFLSVILIFTLFSHYGYEVNAKRHNLEYRTKLASECDDFSGAFAHEYKKFIHSGVESQALKSLTSLMTHSKDIRHTEVERLSLLDQSFLCTACRSAGSVLLDMMKEAEDEDDPIIHAVAKEFCIRLSIQPPNVCDKIIDLNLPILMYIAQNSNVTSESACSTILQGSSCVTTEPEYDLKVNIDSTNAPEIKEHKSHIPPASPSDLKILHLTDIHYDPNYLPGSLAECDEPLCCIEHEFKNGTTSQEKQSGKWSDYRGCDVTWELYTESIKHMKDNHKNIDYIYYTGDVVEHAVWKTSHEGIKESLKVVYDEMKRVFGDTPIYPIIGNHESQPLNEFAPPDVIERFSTQWLYDYLADLWSIWLPPETKETIRIGGYYTFSPRKGFRIIALNNNDAYTFNWWILYKPSYLTVQLQWLHDTLLQAEENNEHVHILAHIPSGEGSTLNNWSREYRKIIERFYHIIGGVFNGHTHFDEFNIFYTSGENAKAINIGWNGGSLTPFRDVNPNYRTYDVETESYQVVGHETFIFNLTEANANPNAKLRWFKEYSFIDFYELKDLSPASLDSLLERFAEDPELLYQYYEIKGKLGDPKLQNGCDTECLMKHICEASTTQFNDETRCTQLQQKLEESLTKKYVNRNKIQL